MKKIVEIALGIVTSVGGFLEIGSITTAAQAGADFSFQLIWALVLGGLCIIFLVEQAGRFTEVSGRTIPDAIRDARTTGSMENGADIAASFPGEDK